MDEDFLLVVNSITVFNFHNVDVRIIDKENDPWFVLIDVCKILDIKNSHDVSFGLDDDDEKNTLAITDGNRVNPETIIINKSGLYSLIFRSRKPEAKRYKKSKYYPVHF